MSCASSMKGFVVNQVNPKFKEYNRPLLLAVVVAIPTAALTLLLFRAMVTGSEKIQEVHYAMASRMSYGINEDARWDAKCALETFYTAVYGGEAVYLPCKVSDVTYCDDAQSAFTSAAGCSDNGAFMAVVRVSVGPGALVTFGAALGYAGLIELALTIVLVFALQLCGVLRGGPEGHLGQMIKEIADGKDTGKEIGAEVGVA